MNRLTTLLSVLFFSLACAGGSGYSELAEEECAIPSDATPCDRCFMETCATQCKECVDDATCYECGSSDTVDEAACSSNEQVALLLTCYLTADCAQACMGEPPPDPSKPPRVGKGRKSGGGRGGKAKSPPADGGDGGGGEGKSGKGGKHKGG